MKPETKILVGLGLTGVGAYAFYDAVSLRKTDVATMIQMFAGFGFLVSGILVGGSGTVEIKK